MSNKIEGFGPDHLHAASVPALNQHEGHEMRLFGLGHFSALRLFPPWLSLTGIKMRFSSR
jgi:hypothetical protein